MVEVTIDLVGDCSKSATGVLGSLCVAEFRCELGEIEEDEGGERCRTDGGAVCRDVREPDERLLRSAFVPVEKGFRMAGRESCAEEVDPVERGPNSTEMVACLCRLVGLDRRKCGEGHAKRPAFP